MTRGFFASLINRNSSGRTQDETVGWHHQLDGREFEQAPGAGDGQGGLASCSPWGHRESDTTGRRTTREGWVSDPWI